MKKGDRSKIVLIMAGGTGGHVFPALAVAKILLAKHHGVAWLGSKYGMEAVEVPKANIRIHTIDVVSMRGKKIGGYLRSIWQCWRSFWQAFTAIRRIKPDCVLGMGGFVAGPGGVAAWLMRCPLVIHEQNAVAGMTNRWLAPLAEQVVTGYPIDLGDPNKNRCVGNPVRQTLLDLPVPQARELLRTDALRLLVLGGSLGAKPINDMMPHVWHAFKGQNLLAIWHQVGDAHVKVMQQAYGDVAQDGEIKVAAFIEDMAKAYAWADLVLCRAGALTVAELSAVGVASILVPLPHAVDDHQTANAKLLVDAGAALLVPQRTMDVEHIVSLICEFYDDRGRLLSMAQKARALAIRDAAEQVATACMECANA